MCAVAVAIAGVLFVLYEVAAPRADETALDGAAAWASAGWSIAHSSAIVALILIPSATTRSGLPRQHNARKDRQGHRRTGRDRQ
ncbi:hypothetical protein G5C66_15875 [Nocardioides sp. KC13]|uniref:DUF998 domain-containing protein n=1 Tax=Nocardioides turkmenicus TaxID=2711220 RepID=A0A6M1R6A2_9ACTN|nr:hypothetical protein [Nocardioides sp. KC13]NGN94211.1 hypothetical protein [Nocardioides sp. KC13]